MEALGITLFESIESKDPTALIGLPLIWLASALRARGIRFRRRRQLAGRVAVSSGALRVSPEAMHVRD